MKKALALIPPAAPQPNEENEREKGKQLTEQFEKATDGMRDVLLFGAMMMRLRAGIVSTMETIPSRGRSAKDTGVKAWLEKYAPAVPQSSAHRFESVALAAQNLFALPDSLAKKIDFPDLVTKAERELQKVDKRLPKKQKELFDFAKGFSQKSLLDTYVEKHGRGGNQYERGGSKGRRRQLSAAQIEKAFRDHGISLGSGLQTYTKHNFFRFLKEADLDALLDVLADAEAALRLWRNMPKGERETIVRATLAASTKAKK